MKKNFKHLCLTLILFNLGISHASVLTPTPEDPWYQRVLQETLSPVTTDARTVFIGGSVLSLGFYLHQKTYKKDFFQSEYGEDKPQGHFSKIGDLSGQLLPNALYTLGMFTYGKFADDENSLRRASFMIRATAYPAAMSTIMKVALKEQRPNGGKYSFPSGHSTTAFAFATAVACEHPWYVGVPAFALATWVGLSRMNDNKHYFHDVLAGATLGSSYALGLYFLDKKRKAPLDTRLTIYPFSHSQASGLGLALIW